MSHSPKENWDAEDAAIADALHSIRMPPEVRSRLISIVTAEAQRSGQAEQIAEDSKFDGSETKPVQASNPHGAANFIVVSRARAWKRRLLILASAACLLIIGSISIFSWMTQTESFDTRSAALEMRDLVRQHIAQQSPTATDLSPAKLTPGSDNWVDKPARQLSIPAEDFQLLDHGLSQLTSGKAELVELRSSNFPQSAWLVRLTPNSRAGQRFASSTFEIMTDASGGISLAIMQSNDSLIVLCVAGGESELKRWLKPVQLT